MRRNPASSLIALAAGLALAGGLAGAGPARAVGPDCGPHVTPSIFWACGDHRLGLSLESRWRIEWWDAHSRNTDEIYAGRSRVGLEYSFRDWLTLFAQFQDARIYSMSPETASGAIALYRNTAHPSGRRSRVHHERLRQLWLEVRPVEGLAIRVGRQDIKLGTQAMYPEANWKYIKIKRNSQRLVGTVGWTHGERSNDGVTIGYDTGGHHIYFFAARPTTGVFEIEDGYTRQDEINYGGISWTVKRETWLPHTELRLFGLAYDDDRPPRHGGRLDDVEIYTLGFSTIGIYPVGPGNFDLFAWGAVQYGDFTPPGSARQLDHLAAAGILEAGYQLTEVPWKPWLRLGVNVASGDGDPDDGDHGTFFNMLPTNHLYYGFADRFAFQNLVDWFGQLMLKPHAKVGVNLMLHHFQLQDDDDFQYFGTGAFNRDVFGYGRRPSNGSRTTATELDVVVSVNVDKHLGFEAGWAYMWGHAPYRNFADDNVMFGYVQASLKY